MKTETNSATDVIWSTSNVELPNFTNEECLPVIGSCQVSSILSNLDTPSDKMTHLNNNKTQQSVQLIVVQNPEYNRITQADTEATQPLKNFVVLKDVNSSKNVTTNDDNDETKKGKNCKVDNLEDMLYFVCNICPFLCTENAKITEHLENSHKNRNTIKLMHLKCPACQNIFYHKVSLRSHLIHDHSVTSSDINRIIQAVVYFSKKNGNDRKSEKVEPNVSCKNEVDYKYVDNKKLLENDDAISNENENENVDERDFSEKDSARQLPKIVSLPTVDITQNSAEKMFNSMIKQNSVSKYLDQKKMHKCIIPMCKVHLQDANKMNYHIGCHVENSFMCLECNTAFAFWKPLTGHLWRVHKIDMELYSCDKCDYKTFSLGKLNNVHKLIHSSVKAFICDVCQKGFKNSKQLRNHKITHKEKSEKLSYTCENCTKTFFDKRQLRVHLDSVHKKIKPFLCNFCGYKGSSKSALKMHIRQHTGEKPFACDSCSYTTADHNSLRRHKLRHSGVKPYKCTHCDYACIQSTTYKVHLRTKHPGLEKDLMFTCSECQFRFVNKSLYESHISTAHKERDFD